MSTFPYSVLRAKKIKNARIVEAVEEIIDSKNIKIDFDNILDDIVSKGLYVHSEDSYFVTSNMNLFYRNNLAVILLTLNIRRHGDQFLSSNYYQAYFNYIARKELKDDEERKVFASKLDFQIRCYNEKIQNIISGSH